MKPDGDAHKQSGDDLKKIVAELTERNKELNCLYAIFRIIEQWDDPLEETLQRVVDSLPPAWQHPENTCAQIIFENQAFKTDNFTETTWRQKCGLLVKESPAGSVEIYLLEPGIGKDEVFFLKEEKQLLEAVTERLGKMIERRRTEAALQKSEQRFKNLVENSITGISIVQNNQIIYQNQEQEKLLGPLPRNLRPG